MGTLTTKAKIQGALRYSGRNPYLGWGLGIILTLMLVSGAGALLVDTGRVDPLSVTPNQPPGKELPLGSDNNGRDLMAVMIVGTPLTLRIGLLAGAVATTAATALALTSAYYGGAIDTVTRTVIDALLTVPVLLVLVIISSMIQGTITVDILALVVASLSWMGPARMIRAQVLTMREKAYVQVARLSGVSGLGIVFREIMPNLIPYLGASFVSAVSSAILAAIGLEALGLGSHNSATLGVTIYYAITYGAMLREMWWWWVPPIIIIVFIFVGLFLITMGLDEIANPRVRRHR
jgi:peptide/nickel transport system permease protein